MLISENFFFLLFLVATSTLTGHSLLKILRIQNYIKISLIKIPLYTSLGLATHIVLLTPISLMIIGPETLVVMAPLWAYSFFSKSASTILSIKISQIKKDYIMSIISLLWFIFIFSFFLVKITEMQWPPVGDILVGHAPVISNLLFNKKLNLLSQEPLAPWPYTYPPGFHILVANIATWFGILPGEAILLVGAFTIILIFWLIYSLTYIYSKSVMISLIAAMSGFVVHPSGNLEKWIIGYLYNGTYPSMMGILLSIASIGILAAMESEIFSCKNIHKKVIIPLIFVWTAIILEYTAFLPLIIAEVLIVMVIVFRKYEKESSVIIKRLKIFLIILVSIIVLILLSLLEVIIGGLSWLSYFLFKLFNYFAEVLPNLRRPINIYFFFDHINGIMMVLAFFSSLILLHFKRYIFISIIYIISFVMVLLSLNNFFQPLSNIFKYLTHQRLFILNWLTAWSVVGLGIDYFLEKALKSNMVGLIYKHQHKNFYKEIKLKPLLLFLYFILISSSLLTPFILEQFEKRPNWYTAQWSWSHDKMGLLWIHYNVPSEDLILNDYSWASLWIYSFSFKNTTSNFYNSLVYLNRTLELNEVWRGTLSPEEVFALLKKYNVSYVFTTSEWGYFEWWKIKGDNKYLPKPLKPKELIKLFDDYKFLQKVFQSGNTAIYKVIYK